MQASPSTQPADWETLNVTGGIVAPRIHPAKHSEFAPDLNQIELGPTEVRPSEIR
jgi:hypothetical protein